MSKKILLLLILFMFALSGCAQKNNKKKLYENIIQRDKLIVGISFDSKPFGFKDSDGQVKGLEADIAHEIAEEILGDKNKVVFKNVKSQERINAAMSEDVDMVISTITITAKRKKLVEFSNPYFIAGQVICVKKGSKINSIDDLLNKKVIVVIGTTGEENIKRFAPNALIQAYADDSDALNAFKGGYGDAITTDDALLQSFVLENPDYVILPNRLTQEPYGIALKKSKYTSSFKRNINKVLNEIKINGVLNSIKNKWEVN